MRRTASEVLRSLEMRIARLERQAQKSKAYSFTDAKGRKGLQGDVVKALDDRKKYRVTDIFEEFGMVFLETSGGRRLSEKKVVKVG